MFCSRSGAVTLREGSLEACSKPCVDEQAPQSLFLQQPRVLRRAACRAGGASPGGSYTG